MSQIFPRQPEAQEQVLGLTHFPLFKHIGSHTPKHTYTVCASLTIVTLKLIDVVIQNDLG